MKLTVSKKTTARNLRLKNSKQKILFLCVLTLKKVILLKTLITGRIEKNIRKTPKNISLEIRPQRIIISLLKKPKRGKPEQEAIKIKKNKFLAFSPIGCELVKASLSGKILDFDETKEIKVKKVKKLIPR